MTAGIRPEALSVGRGRDVLIGSRGWDHAAWRGTFYPDDLPRDWRLAYYANVFRAVLVPSPALSAALSGGYLDLWTDEVHADFRFYLEVGGPLMQRWRGGGAAFVAALAPLRALIGGVVVDMEGARLPGDEMEAWFGALCPLCAVAVRSPEGEAEMARAFQAHGVGGVWTQDSGPPAVRPGCYGEIGPEPGSPMDLRRALESFMQWGHDCDEAMLCFEPGPRAPAAMQQARIIAELLAG